jgi:hypothetical protein
VAATPVAGVEDGTVVDGQRTHSGRWRTAVRAGVAGVVAATAVLAAPGTALAAGTITPLLDCWTVSGSTTTLVLGYSNTKSKAAVYDVGGSSNHWSPSRYDGPQPDTLEVGTFHGSFAVRMDSADVPTTTWTLGSTTLDVSDAMAATGSCPPGTALPADGNGTGLALTLVAAGGLGVLALRRGRRLAG